MGRQSQIIKFLNANHNTDVNEIARHFGVTPTSIRRDLVKLEASGLVKRTHGRAQLASASPPKDYAARGALFSEEKERIARAALQFIQPRQAILFDSGTTTLALAKLLSSGRHRELTVITATLPIASELASSGQVLVSGGLVQAEAMSLIGPEADAYMRNITCDMAFMGSSGIRRGVGFTASSPFFMSIKKEMLKATKHAIALVDSSKFGKDGVYLFSTFAERKIQTIITVRTDENADEPERIEKAGITIIDA